MDGMTPIPPDFYSPERIAERLRPLLPEFARAFEALCTAAVPLFEALAEWWEEFARQYPDQAREIEERSAMATFRAGDRVRVRDTGWTGTVEYLGAGGLVAVRFDPGQTEWVRYAYLPHSLDRLPEPEEADTPHVVSSR